jgi:hypothetical protein
MKKLMSLVSFLMLFSSYALFSMEGFESAAEAVGQKAHEKDDAWQGTYAFTCADVAYNGNTLRTLAQFVRDFKDVHPLSEEAPQLHMAEFDQEPTRGPQLLGQRIMHRGNLRCLNGRNCVISCKGPEVSIGDDTDVETFPRFCSVVGHGEELLLVANDGSLHPAGPTDMDKLGHREFVREFGDKKPRFNFVDSSYVSPTGLLPMRFKLGGESKVQTHVGLYDVRQWTLVRLIDFQEAHEETTRFFARPCDQTIVVVYENDGLADCAQLYDPRTGTLEKNIVIDSSRDVRTLFGKTTCHPDWLVPAHNPNVVAVVQNNSQLHGEIVSRFDWRKENEPISSSPSEGLYESGAISDDGEKIAIGLMDCQDSYKFELHEFTYNNGDESDDVIMVPARVKRHSLSVARSQNDGGIREVRVEEPTPSEGQEDESSGGWFSWLSW